MDSKGILFISAAVILLGGIAGYAIYAKSHSDDNSLSDAEAKFANEIHFVREDSTDSQ